MAITPLASYQAALNYRSENADDKNAAEYQQQQPQPQSSSSSSSDKDRMASFKKIIARMNNSIYIHPTISVLLFTISTIFIAFSKSINILYKIFAVLLLFIYIAITVYWFKK